jgi:hypothetical protein
MKIRIPFLAVAALAIGPLVLSVMAQDDPPTTTLRMIITTTEDDPPLLVGGADPDSPDWRSLGPDVGLMLGPEERGVARATLYVRSGSRWTPVAVDGFAEIGSDNMLLQR